MMRPDGGYRASEQVHKAKHKYRRRNKHKKKIFEDLDD